MRLRGISVDGFRGLPDRSFPLVDPGSGKAAALVVVTGPTGSGKTSFLEAIIAAKEKIAAYGPIKPDRDWLRPGATSAKVKTEWEITPAERDRVGATRDVLMAESLFGAAAPVEFDDALLALLGNYESDPEVPKVEYFHASREMSLGGGVDATKLSDGGMDRMFRLGRDNAKYDPLVKFIVAAGLGLDIDDSGKPRPQGRVTQAFAKLCTTKKLAGLYRAGDGVFPGFQDSAGRPLGLTQISSGELDALLFAATFVRSGVRNSVVLIDSPELHRSDLEAKLFVEGLMAIEQDNQLIVATRAPSIIGMVPRTALVTLAAS
jgi:hypothetical protein